MTIEEELETTGETVIQEETPTGEIQGTAQPVATTTQKPDDYDDPDDDVDPSISRKNHVGGY